MLSIILPLLQSGRSAIFYWKVRLNEILWQVIATTDRNSDDLLYYTYIARTTVSVKWSVSSAKYSIHIYIGVMSLTL